MIIDFHTHIFPDTIAAKTVSALGKEAGLTPTTDGTADGLMASMDEAGVDVSVVLPVVTKPAQFESINEFAVNINATCGGRLLSFGGIHPDSEDYKKDLKHIKDLGLIGIKLHPDYQGVDIDDVRYMNIIEYADELGLIIITHAGIDIGIPDPVCCPPDKMRKVLDKIKPKKMVAAHYGGWKQWDAVYEYLAGENVYLDTAFIFDYIEEEMFYKVMDKHDTGKILFATDCPWSSQKRDIEIVKKLSIAEDMKEAVLYQNAKRLLHL